jgi:hypothetical protein
LIAIQEKKEKKEEIWWLVTPNIGGTAKGGDCFWTKLCLFSPFLKKKTKSCISCIEIYGTDIIFS